MQDIKGKKFDPYTHEFLAYNIPIEQKVNENI